MCLFFKFPASTRQHEIIRPALIFSMNFSQTKYQVLSENFFFSYVFALCFCVFHSSSREKGLLRNKNYKLKWNKTIARDVHLTLVPVGDIQSQQPSKVDNSQKCLQLGLKNVVLILLKYRKNSAFLLPLLHPHFKLQNIPECAMQQDVRCKRQ